MLESISADTFEPSSEGLAFDEIVHKGLRLCGRLPSAQQYEPYRSQIADLSERLSAGRLHLAVLGQFNRGKSTFINALLGMPVLPVSVLPITSIPTIITYGGNTSCMVEFAGEKEPVKAGDTLEEIARLLCEYVAEENNPQNCRNVAKVTVTCDSAILSHGTVLIDTPGFGSTHVHNTKTTRRLIEGCDAALFLLSADLPITQVEVEFLQELRRYVPRIFFIYNKADILSDEELEKTTAFVRNTLSSSLHIPADTAFFPISAKTGQEAESHNIDNESWAQSGMERIKTEIIDFMLREKYFALSEALNDKYKSAIVHILELLREERAQRIAPIEKLTADTDAAIAYKEAFRKEVSQRLDQLSHDEKMLLQRLSQHLSEDKERLRRKVEHSLNSILETAAATAGSLDVVQSSLQNLYAEFCEHMFVKLAAALDKPLQNRIAAYAKSLEIHIAKIAADISLSTERLADDIAGLFELHYEAIESWKPGVALEFPKESWHHKLHERLQSKTARLNSYKQKLLPVLIEHSDMCHQQLANAARNRLRTVFAQLAEMLSHRYTLLISYIDQWLSAGQQELHRIQTMQQPHIAHADSLRQEFETVRKALA